MTSPAAGAQGLGDKMSASSAGSPRALRRMLAALLASHDVRLRCGEAAWQFRHARLSAFGAEDGVLRPYGGIVRAAAMVGAFAAEQVALAETHHERSPFSSRQYHVQFMEEDSSDS